MSTFEDFMRRLRIAIQPYIWDAYKSLNLSPTEDFRDAIKNLKKAPKDHLASKFKVDSTIVIKGFEALHELLIISAHYVNWDKTGLSHYAQDIQLMMQGLTGGRVSKYIEQEWLKI